MAQQESISASGYQARLRQLGAVYKPDRSSAKRHIYYSGALRRWIAVKRHPQRADLVVLSYHVDCPCAYSDD